MHMRMREPVSFALTLGLVSPEALAAGFALAEQSAASLGTASAGAAAAAEDASTIAYNPAGIASLNSTQLVANGTLYMPSLPFTNQGSVLAAGVPNIGPDDNGATAVPVPSFFISHPLTTELAIGLGVFSSFGSATDYRSDWVGRYQAQSTELTSIDFAPTITYRLAPSLAIGFSPVGRYSKAKFSNRIDFGTIGASIGIPGAIPGRDDGAVKMKASDWSMGFNSGILLDLTPGTRFGFAYFHNGSVRFRGSAKFERSALGNVISSASGGFINTDATADVAYPDYLNFGVVQVLTQETDVRAGLTWTQWSSFRELRIVFANPQQPDTVTLENWRNTITADIGITYRPQPNFVLRAGVSYGQTPVPSASVRTPRLPDSNRVTMALGAGYSVSQDVRLDLAYGHLFDEDVGLDVISATGDRLHGKTSVSGNILALQLTVHL
jgi:long-chain fatty acid transport protein